MQIAIVSGGVLEAELIPRIEAHDLIVACDQGAVGLLQHQIIPDRCVGDFDSLPSALYQELEQMSTVIERFPAEKDYTDTELAVHWALAQKPTRITLFAAIGSRIDHSLANLYLLLQGCHHQIPIYLETVHSEATLLTPGEYRLTKREEYPYLSFLPVTMEVTGVDLEGFRYPLAQAVFRLGETLGVSNELVTPTATLRFCTGYLFMIWSKDE